MKLRVITVLAAIAVAATACGSTTSGHGVITGTPGASSSADFPSAPATGSAPPSAGPSSDQASSGAATGTPATSTTPIGPQGTPIATKTVHTPDGPYVVKIWAQARNASCAGHAYGKAVIAFLKKHPCQRLQRILGTTTVNGRPVAIAESATSFGASGNDPYEITGKFTQLLQRDGTGSLNDLLREGRRIPQGPRSIPAKEVFKVLSQDNVVTVWDAWYLDGPTASNDPALLKMIEDMFLLL